MDIQEIRAGRDFREAIDDALASSRVVLAVIGPRWLEPEDGRRRLFEGDDLVNLEISRALALPDVHVIPVLVGEARLPSADELPDRLAPWARRQAFQLSDTRWERRFGTNRSQRLLAPNFWNFSAICRTVWPTPPSVFAGAWTRHSRRQSSKGR